MTDRYPSAHQDLELTVDPAGPSSRCFATVIGAGPGGIAAAVELKKRGIEDFIVLEQNDTAGGTWALNRYPGLCCDIQSILYGFSFEKKVDWSRTYARQPEILAYLHGVVEKYSLAPHISYGTRVVSAAWVETDQEWRVMTRDGRVVTSRVLVGAVGMFNRIRWPEIEGLSNFEGRVVHSALWPDEGLDVADKRVAVIGSAASAVQLTPEIAPEARSLTVYQRTSNWVFPKDDETFTEADLETFRSSPELMDSKRDEVVAFMERLLTFADPEIMDGLRADAVKNLSVVSDPEVRRRLTPTAPIGAQRPLFSNTYYPIFNEDHVDLVTTQISRVTPTGIVTADGRQRDVDIIIAATGYDTSGFLSVIDVNGRGVTLAELWAEGPYAYKGITVPGFPNMFMLYGPNTNGGSIITMLELQVEYIGRKLSRLAERAGTSIEVRPEATNIYNEFVQREIKRLGIWETVGSRYYRSHSGRIVTQWPGTMADYRKVLTEPDDEAYTGCFVALTPRSGLSSTSTTR